MMNYVVSALTLGKGWGYLKFEKNEWRMISNKSKADVFKTKKTAVAIKREVIKYRLFDDAFIEVLK